ncbi:MAG: Omp28-related outer membrane protein [candidate division WOR-3 bacterium]
MDAQFPLHSPEGRLKFRAYPPPYQGGYYTPWLWVDGRQRGSTYSNWATYVSQRLPVPADVQINISGTYNPANRQGEAVIEMVSSSSSPISASAFVVVTEDSIYYAGPNGDPWHNHVCRDYVPDHNGTPVSIPAGGVDTLVMPFALDPSWNENRCNVVVYLQGPVQTDSTRPTYNGATVEVMSLVGLAEPRVPAYQRVVLSCQPNPCRGRAVFNVASPAGTRYRLSVFAADGSLAWERSGISSAETDLVWDTGRMPKGVYSCRLTTAAGTATAKLVLVE